MQYGEPVLYFHFYAANGLPASLPMLRECKVVPGKWEGVPKALYSEPTDLSLVIGYRCPCCTKLFFACDTAGLKHGCMNNGGVVHGRA